MTIIVIDGNIGSGKSTVINKLDSEYSTICENIHLFKPWLNLYYTNMSKYALGFQIEVLMSHMKNKILIDKSDINIVERSPLSCLHIFGKNLLNNNILSEIEHNLCIKMNKEYGWLPKIIIYLKTSPKVSLERLMKRNRIGENNISLKYLSDINNLYDKLYLENNKFKVYILDGNKSIEEVYSDVKNILFKYNDSPHLL